MARIKQYETDNTITGGDKLLGTDIVGNATENFSVAALKEFFDSGINIVLPVPPGGVPVVNRDATNVEISGLRAGRTTQTTDITFTALENKGVWRLVADGSAWYLEVIDYTNRYYLHSIVGKTLEFKFINVTELTVKINVDELVKQDGPPNTQDGEVYDYRIDDDGTEREVVFRYSITFDDIDDIALIANNPTPFTEVSVLAADNGFQTLDLLTFYVDSHLVGSTAEFEEIDLGELIFDTVGDGIIWSEDGEQSGITAKLADGGVLNIGRQTTGSQLVVEPVTTFESGVNALASLGVQGGTTLYGALEAQGASDFTGQVRMDKDLSLVAAIPEGTDKSKIVVNHEGIVQTFYEGVETKDITYVIPNGNKFQEPYSGGLRPVNDRGQLTSIQVGDDYYYIPTAVSRVASVLPGLSEGLTGAAAAFNSGTFFYGEDKGTYATWESTPATQPASFAVAEDDTQVTITSTDRANVGTIYDAIPTNQRLFFVADGEDLPSTPGDRVEHQTYEIVSYIQSDGELNFTLIGDGNIIISAPRVSVTNIPNADDAERFVLLDPDTSELEYRDLPEIAGFAATMNYVDQINNNNSGQVKSLTFVGNHHNHNIRINDGAIEVDVTGRMPFNENSDPSVVPTARVDDFTAVEWYSYILDDITETKTVTLPPSSNLSTGDIVRIINLSDLDANGNQQTPGALWSVTANSGDRIMKLPASESTIELNDASSNDFIWSGIDSIGWIIK